MDPVLTHFGPEHWWAFPIYALVYVLFVGFLPFLKKSGMMPSGAYLAFVVACGLEMFGVPMGMYIIRWILGFALPDGILWGHTLVGYLGLAPTNMEIAIQLVCLLLVISGWSE